MKVFGRYFLFSIALSIVLAAGFSGHANADLVFSDNFNGTTTDSSKWYAPVAPIGTPAFTQNNGLVYGASSGNWTGIQARSTFSDNFEAVLSFSNFSTTTVLAEDYRGMASSVSLAMGDVRNQVVVSYGLTPLGRGVGTFGFNGETRALWGMSGGPLTTTYGLLKLSYVGDTVSAYCDTGSGWAFLGALTPGWTEPANLWIGGINLPDGTTSFTVNSVSVATTPVPAALWLFAPGLAGLVAVRRRIRK